MNPLSRRWLLVPTLLVLFLPTVTSCADPGDAADDGSAEDDGVVVASPPVGEPPASERDLSALAYAPTEGSSDPAELLAARWQPLGALESGRVVAISYTLDACAQVDHVEVDETATEVVIGVWTLGPDPGQPCAQSAQVVEQLVRLAEPLGARRLVDPSQ